MPNKSISKLQDPEIASHIRRQNLALWVLPGCELRDLRPLSKIRWVKIWNESTLDCKALYASNPEDSRIPLTIELDEKDSPNQSHTQFICIYQLRPNSRMAGFSEKRLASAIELGRLKVEEVSVLLIVVGPAAKQADYVDYICELSPTSRVLVIDHDFHAEHLLKRRFYHFAGDSENFAEQYKQLMGGTKQDNELKLKNQISVPIDKQIWADVSVHWEILSSVALSPEPVEQDHFDKFLTGEATWSLLASGVAYRRSSACQILGDKQHKQGVRRFDFVTEVLSKIEFLEQEMTSSQQALRQILLYCEAGSGVTTQLRQLAVEAALAGYPTLFCRPFVRDLNLNALEKLIVQAQDAWRAAHKPQEDSTKAVQLPFCLILDTDSEELFERHFVAQRFSRFGRRLMIVRALQRSTEEIAKETKRYILKAETTEQEILNLGSHLSNFCTRHGLDRLPSSLEWKAYHDGIKSMATRKKTHDVSPLFLIGLYPFVKDRAVGEHSLEQYYYKKWKKLTAPGAQELVRTLAAAGAYGISLPYEVVRRDIRFAQSLLFRSADEDRQVDTFIRWGIDDAYIKDWYVAIRHPIIGQLLCRALNPVEGSAPYSALEPLLRSLGVTEGDIWLADQLAQNLGRKFGQSNEQRFSLETDIPIQRAARAIFAAIPETVKELGHSIHHHEGRYHMQVLWACVRALNKPQNTTLTSEQVHQIAQQELATALQALGVALERKQESASNIYNTIAHAYFVYTKTKSTDVKALVTNGFDFQEKAIHADANNVASLLQFVRQAIELVKSPKENEWTDDEKMALYARAEVHLLHLLQLRAERRWRNIDPIEGERQLGVLIDDYLATLGPLMNTEQAYRFKVHHPEAARFLEIRRCLGDQDLDKVLSDPENSEKANEVRRLREELRKLPPKTADGIVYLYKLYTRDPSPGGRAEFRRRLDLIQDLRRLDLESSYAFLHDEAALHCQLGNLETGAERFKALRKFLEAKPGQWLWTNERVLLSTEDGKLSPKKITLKVKDSEYAYIDGTTISLVYQQRYFGEMEKGYRFRACIGFTQRGFQAIQEEFALEHLKNMGIT